jgi:hypothetical protein
MYISRVPRQCPPPRSVLVSPAADGRLEPGWVTRRWPYATSRLPTVIPAPHRTTHFGYFIHGSLNRLLARPVIANTGWRDAYAYETTSTMMRRCPFRGYSRS